MSFNKLTAFTQKVADSADQLTGNPAETKAIFDKAPEELRTYFNNLIDALKSTTSGDSGAKNVGATAITNLTGTDIQSLLEDLASKTYSPPDIKTPTLLNNWVTNAAGSAIYWKDKDNTVFFQLALKSGATAANVVIMNFPAGFIPDREYLFRGYCEGSGVTNNNVIYHVTNSPSGELKLLRDIGAGNGLLILQGAFKATN